MSRHNHSITLSPMDLSGIIIIISGLIIISSVVLLMMMREQPANKGQDKLPQLKNQAGQRFSSVAKDIPAQDGGSKRSALDSNASDLAPQNDDIQATAETTKSTAKEQHAQQMAKTKHEVLFVSTHSTHCTIDELTKALAHPSLSLGEHDIYHCQTLIGKKSIALFKVASAAAPWTLTDADINKGKIPGLSLVLNRHNISDDIADEAQQKFLTIAREIAKACDGKLMDEQQQTL